MVNELSSQDMARLIQNVEEGLVSYDVSVSMQCCSIIDNIITFFKTEIDKNQGNNNLQGDIVQIQRFIQEQPNSLLKVLNMMFGLVMTGDYQSTWSISRPLLGLILLHENQFVQMKEQHIQNAGSNNMSADDANSKRAIPR